MGKSKLRQSNFELLKVLSILMVIVLHYFNGGMGGGLLNVPRGSFNFYAMNFLESMSIVAVNCFVLVSGYFMIDKKQVKVRKFVNLIGINVFYGLLMYAIKVIFVATQGNFEIDIKGLAKAIIPFHGAKWFVGSYSVLFLLSPYLNILLNQLSKKQFIQLLFVLVISFSVIPTILPIISYNDRGYGVLSFILLYCIGAYLKTYPLKLKSKALFLGIYLLSTSATYVLLLYLGESSFALNYNTIFNITSSVSLLLFFSRITFHSRNINFLSSFSFAVYLIHTDSAIILILFKEILKTNLFWDSNLFLVHLLGSVVLIFIGCVSIEVMRRYFVSLIGERLIMNLLDKISVGI